MAFTVEGNLALKDMFIRSDFRLVDVELRADSTVLRTRVSTLLASELAARESQDLIRELPPFIPGEGPFNAPPPGQRLSPEPPGAPGDGEGVVRRPGTRTPEPSEEEPPPGPVAARAIIGRQVYTVRGANVPFNVVRSSNIISDGILTRVRGSTISPSDFEEFDNGIRLIISDSDEITTVARVPGDFDLFVVGFGGTVLDGSHGIGLGRENAVGESAGVDTFDIPFHRVVRAGQRFGVDLNAGGHVSYWATFEVTQFAEFEGGAAAVRERIVESIQAKPNARGFDPILMVLPGREEVLPKVVTSQSEFIKWFQNSWVPKGRLTSRGVVGF